MQHAPAMPAAQLGPWMATALIGGASLSTKAAGLAWFGLTLVGVWAWWRERAQPVPMRGDTAPALAWLGICLLALALKTVPVLYWDAAWSDRHAEFRLLIGAFGAYLLARHLSARADLRAMAGHGLAIAGALALALALVAGSDAAPTNRIPWAAGISLLSCTLLAWSDHPDVSARCARWWKAASFLAFVAVLISGVRGSLALLLVWPAMLWLGAARSDRGTRRIRWPWLAGAVCVLLTAVSLGPADKAPLERLRQVAIDLGQGERAAPDPNSSTGVRLIMWRTGLASFAQHPTIGIGPQGLRTLLHDAGERHQSDEVRRLRHFHSDYVDTAVEFGLWGLTAYLCYGLGMAGLAIWLHRRGRLAEALGVAGMLVMHVTTGISNKNFGHNYYPTMLSLCLGLMLWSASHPARVRALDSHGRPP